MAMMMTGRVLLVCALCVLWCGLSGIAADGSGVVSGASSGGVVEAGGVPSVAVESIAFDAGGKDATSNEHGTLSSEPVVQVDNSSSSNIGQDASNVLDPPVKDLKLTEEDPKVNADQLQSVLPADLPPKAEVEGSHHFNAPDPLPRAQGSKEVLNNDDGDVETLEKDGRKVDVKNDAIAGFSSNSNGDPTEAPRGPGAKEITVEQTAPTAATPPAKGQVTSQATEQKEASPRKEATSSVVVTQKSSTVIQQPTKSSSPPTNGITPTPGNKLAGGDTFQNDQQSDEQVPEEAAQNGTIAGEELKTKPETTTEKGPNSTDDNKQVDNAAIGNSNGGQEEKNGVTLQVQDEVVKPKEEKEVKKELEEKEKQKAQGNKQDEPEDLGEDAEDTEDSADGTDHKEGEGQKEGDAGSNKKGKELNGGGDTDGTPPDAPVVLQPAPPVEVTDPQSIEKTNDDDTGGKEDAGRTQTQEAAGPSQAENLTAELSTEEVAAETETGTPGKKTQPEDAGKEQTTVGAKSNPETPAAETEAHNREEVPKEEEDSEKATTNENFDGRQTAVNDNAHNEAENTRQENENELDKAEETTAEVKEKEETTERKTVAAKDPNLNSTAATDDSDGSTAVSHTTSPLLLLLLVVACAAAAAVVAA
ncbi:mucin-associated surface protein (MASP), putative [Trypanosoma cruzi]|uniref:Mucin-associated surface protein (MASP), putative n=1 Tax=Trypanosoma cruzi (strain CL Brener) TaxID=353153 RepID=Q4CVN8_TRYCC|nr:mucin-associated surface protein (MASP), putative [Trypanosoma cruzi]EAN84341.1 mucin-associated surface protein (MASP), putative [Trypanosoma cruzi]|eukprot:XP_806192.1 mucin-associated surface protein (MASP) [Trypanosoma cruzi strain CL Brener]